MSPRMPKATTGHQLRPGAICRELGQCVVPSGGNPTTRPSHGPNTGFWSRARSEGRPVWFAVGQDGLPTAPTRASGPERAQRAVLSGWQSANRAFPRP